MRTTPDDDIRRGLRALRTVQDIAATLTLIGETLGDACSEFTVADGVAVFKWPASPTVIAADATRAERMEAVAKACNLLQPKKEKATA